MEKANKDTEETLEVKCNNCTHFQQLNMIMAKCNSPLSGEGTGAKKVIYFYHHSCDEYNQIPLEK